MTVSDKISSSNAGRWTTPLPRPRLTFFSNRPLPAVVYPCHACRLELVVDGHTQKLVLAPFPTELDHRNT